MVLLMIAAFVSSIAFGSLGWWADNYSVVPVVTAVFGASFGGRLLPCGCTSGRSTKAQLRLTARPLTSTLDSLMNTAGQALGRPGLGDERDTIQQLRGEYPP
jgi:hypothetical protein